MTVPLVNGMPSRVTWPRTGTVGGSPCCWHSVAVSLVISFTASSSVKACFSRTQWLKRCVCSEESMICETCAPESENVTTERGCRIISSTWSWFSFAIGWRKYSSAIAPASAT